MAANFCCISLVLFCLLQTTIKNPQPRGTLTMEWYYSQNLKTKGKAFLTIVCVDLYSKKSIVNGGLVFKQASGNKFIALNACGRVDTLLDSNTLQIMSGNLSYHFLSTGNHFYAGGDSVVINMHLMPGSLHD